MIHVAGRDIRFVSKYRRKFLKMKSRKSTISKALSLRLEVLENRELLSAAPWSAPVDTLDAQAVEIASAQLEQDDVIDLSNAQLKGSVSEALFVYSGDYTVKTNYDAAAKKLQISAKEVDGAVTYYLWKPAPKSGNMAIYQRCQTPDFTVSNLVPGQTTDFRVSAYDSKGAVLNSEEFKFASVSLDAPKTYRAGNALDVTVGANASLNYDLSWFYVTETEDLEISEANGNPSFVPDAATYPIKIVATPIADTEGLYVCDPVEAIVEPFNVQLENSVSFVNTGVTDNQYSLSWKPIDGASTYTVKINRDGTWIQYNKGLTETSCVMNGLYARNTYEIRVYAVNESGRLTGDYIETTFAPVRVVRSVNKFVAGDELSVSVLGSDDASCEIAWYYATPNDDVEITEARGNLSYAPTNPKHDVKVVVTGTGLSEGSASETLFVYSDDYTVQTNYDPALKTLKIEAPAVEGAVKYYIWKPAPKSGNMAIYQRTTKPVFTVSNLSPGTTTDFRVSAYDAKGKVLDSIDFKFASVALNAPERYKAGNSLEVAVRADAPLKYDLSWYYVTEAGDVEISKAKDQTSFIPNDATYPIKIVATPIADAVGLCVSAPVEAIVDPYVPQFGLNDPYVTTKRSFVTTWGAVPDATRYAVQKLNANGAWVKMTAFDVVDGQIVGDTRATLSEDGTQFSYSVNMVKIGVEETYRVLAIDPKGAVIEKAEFTYNPVGLTVENDAYDLANGAQTLRAVTVQGIDDSLQYQWYYSTNDDPTNWQIVDGANSAELVLSADAAAQNYNYKVLATDPNEDRQSVAYARADTLDAPTILTETVDAATGNLLLTWNADANLSADNFIVQYYRTDGEYSAWSDLPQGTISVNGDGTFSLTHVNGAKYKYLRVRANDATGWSEWHMTIPGGLVVDTKMDAIDPNDGYTSWREAIDAYQALAAEGAIPPGIAVTFDPKVFKNSSSKISLKVDQPTVVITENVRIDASNLGYRLQIQAPNSKRNVFEVIGENASLELVSLNIFGANHAIDGPIIRAEDGATVKVVDCTFASNRTSQHGGVIALSNGSKLIVENCLFQNNRAQLGGGAIYAVDGSSVTVKDSTFTNNTAGGNGNGGAIWFDASSTLDVENSTFTPNGASNLSGSVTSSKGSAIWKDDAVVSAALLDAALIDLEEEITLF